MSSDQRGSGGGLGAAFVLLIFVGFVVKFWIWIAVAFGAAVAFGLLLWAAFYAARRIDAREDARIAIAARADRQHAVGARRRRPRRLRRAHTSANRLSPCRLRATVETQRDHYQAKES